MINYIKGTVSLVGDSFIILENNGIGYQIGVPASDLYRFGEGVETTVFTYLAVKEDDLSLYGFLSLEELKMFKNLISVSGIGPKGALSILSGITVEDLKMAIIAENAKLISSSKGVGLKTAQKIVVDLKGKIEKEGNITVFGSSSIPNKETDIINEAVTILTTLGYSHGAALQAVNSLHVEQGMTASDIAGEALRNIG